MYAVGSSTNQNGGDLRFRWRQLRREVRLRVIGQQCRAIRAGHVTDTSDLDALLQASADISNEDLLEWPEALRLRVATTSIVSGTEVA